jgi:uncharacterized membrane protein
MTGLIVVTLVFAGLHLGVAGSPARRWIVGAIGERAYQAAFSMASILALVALIRAYGGAPYIETWGQPNLWKPVAIVLMLPAFLLVVVGLSTRNPTTVGLEAAVARPPEGIVRVTRHPFLIGVALWAFVHLVANGDFASLLFFGCFLVVALAGTVSIDAKRRSRLGAAAWQTFSSRTSIVPFAAILQKRNRLDMAEIGQARMSAALVAYILFLGGHAHLIGVSPFPH